MDGDKLAIFVAVWGWISAIVLSPELGFEDKNRILASGL